MSARISRDSDTLKRKYQNMKKRSKARYADEKLKTIITASGRFEETQVISVDEKLRSMLGVQVTGDVSEFDSDSVLHGEEIGNLSYILSWKIYVLNSCRCSTSRNQ
jgi:hypothetical protein